MAYKYVSEFTVTGTGPFPLDMLRYDSCSPLRSEDANSIGLEMMKAYEAGERSVRLRRVTEGKGRNMADTPTEARWRSFGWHVSDVSFRKVD